MDGTSVLPFIRSMLLLTQVSTLTLGNMRQLARCQIAAFGVQNAPQYCAGFPLVRGSHVTVTPRLSARFVHHCQPPLALSVGATYDGWIYSVMLARPMPIACCFDQVGPGAACMPYGQKAEIDKHHILLIGPRHLELGSLCILISAVPSDASTNAAHIQQVCHPADLLEKASIRPNISAASQRCLQKAIGADTAGRRYQDQQG